MWNPGRIALTAWISAGLLASVVLAADGRPRETPPQPRSSTPVVKPDRVPTERPSLWQVQEALHAPRQLPERDAPTVDVGFEAGMMPPGPDDLDPTIDVQITQEIIDLADELGSARAIYEFVRNQCRFQPYYGSQKGSVETLRQRAGNDYDLASLLIALLRSAGIPSRYAEGVVEMPVDRVTSWLAVDDGEVAGSILFTNGLEGVILVSGPNVVAVRCRRIWVEAFVQNGFGSPAWVPLDPAFAMTQVHAGLDVPAEMGFDALAFVDDYWDPADPQVILPRPETLVELFQQEITDYLAANHPGLTLDDARRTEEIIPQSFSLLPKSLPYTVRSRDGSFPEIPAARRYQIRFHLYDGATDLIDETVNLPETAGRRVTIDYEGATPADQAIIDANGGIYATPPSQVDLRPLLRIDGQLIATGAAGVGMGLLHSSDIHFLAPVNGQGLPQNVVPAIFNVIVTGASQAIGLAVEGSAERLLIEPPADDTEGTLSLQYDTAMDYMAQVRAAELELGRLMHDFVTTGVTSAILENVVKVTVNGFGVPQTFDWVGLRVDADRSVIGVWEVDDLGPLSGEPRDFLIIGGAEGSLWENRVFEEAFGQDSVSTIKILELAIDAGVTVYTRWNTLPLPANTQPLSVRQAIQNSILNGQEVTFPADPMTIGSPGTGEWTGTGWIDMDPSSGAAGYLISGGNNGGATVEFWPPEFIDLQEGDRTVVQVTIEITKPDNDSPDTDAIFTRANVQHLEFEYLVHVTYDDASMATLGPYKKTTRNTTKTFQPGNYTFKVWIARFIWWGVLAQAERKVSIVGVLIREDDGTEAGAAPPKLLCLKPAGQTPEVKKLKARVIPAKASDGTTDMGSMYAWSGGSKIMLNPTNTQAADASITGDQPSGSANDQPINVNVTLVDGKVVAGVAEFKFGAEQDKKHEMTALKAEIDGFVDGDMATAGRKIDNLVERGATATTDDDARVLTGGYVQFQLDLQPQNVETDPGLKLSFEWSASAGTLEEDKTRKDVKWDAPSGENSENALMLTAQIKNDGKLEGTKSATIKPVKPRVIRTKFVDDGSNNFINLLDEENSALIEAPQYDRLNLTWETASSHEAGQGDHKNEDSKVFKNESIAYVKGSKLRVLADLAARDAEGGTATEEKDLSAATPVRLKAVDSAPSLTFNTGAAFDVMDWSVKDYDAHAAETTLTSTETLGETGTKIRFYYETTLKWTIEVKDKTGAWVNALGGTTTWDTTHRSLCVANAKPIIPVYPVGAGAIITTANQAWEKVMQYSCDWAKGQGGAGAAAQKAIVDAQWAGIDQNDTSGTGARHNINYTFVGQPAFNTRDFAKAGCHGSCGHQARFFSDIGGAQGISVNIRSIALMPTAFGHATDLAVGVQDIDGDWREATYPAGPAAGGNPLWWFNAPVGVPNPTEHSATEFAGDIYDPTFGVKHTGTWNSYIASAVTLWFIRIDATTGAWKSKATVNADGNTVRWESFTNYASSGIVTWSPIP